METNSIDMNSQAISSPETSEHLTLHSAEPRKKSIICSTTAVQTWKLIWNY
jgi:hypothetical protein